MKNKSNDQVISFNILDEESNISLTKVIYTGHIVGKFNTWTVEQEYLNLNADQSVEIYYTFPLKAGATVTSFRANIGDKELKGVVKEKEQAHQEYQQAIASGDSAYLMENVDSNIFKMSLGRVMPNELVKITIGYLETCDVYDNQIDILLPTLVGQRYNDIISNQLIRDDKVSYSCDFIINIEDNLSVKDIDSSSHTIKVMNNKQVVSLNNKLNRDFKLEIKLDNEFKTTALINGHYLLVDVMPKLEEPQHISPKKYIFVIDRSGSMEGRNMNAVKDLLNAALAQLEPDDLIEIISFGSTYDVLFNTLKTVVSVRKELKDYINSLSANMGGTEILGALKKSLTLSNNANIILITDGQVGNEEYISNQVLQNIKNNHLFLFGLDMNVNESFLDKIAKAGRGKAYYFAPDESHFTNKLIRAFSNINSAISAKVKLTTNNKELDRYIYSDVAFNYEYWTAILKLDHLNEDILVTIDNTVTVIKKEDVKETNIELNKVFASRKINYYESLMSRDLTKSDGYKKLIIKTAIEHQIDSKYTSFLAINERDQKVYDVPQIEETPVMNSFDSFSAMDMFSPQLVEDVGNYFAYADPSQYEPFDYDENEEALEIKLLELIDAIESGEFKTIKSLILEINDIIIKISSEDVISITAIELINEIKSLDRLIYDQLLKGVQEEIKTLFKNH
ncbi:MAG: VIT and VWA domain-containing protein [Candidatus Cloacimonetes bacterium]|nr:VIT and VWA domain-containing protein [Candidatus Cloacimonadota bacterium]